MFEKLDLLLIGMWLRAEGYLDDLIHEEKGAADIVAILVVIVVVIAVVGVFKNNLMNIIDKVFDKATTTLTK